ncbi:MAG: ATP-binding protein, partial [Phototrophicaceae bacterium]
GEAVKASKTSLFLHDGSEVDWNYIFTARSMDDATSSHVVRSVLDKGLAGWVVRQRQGAIIPDTDTDDRWHIFPDDTLPVRSAMCVPLMYSEQVVAVLTLVHPQPNHFSEYHLRLMTIIANQATVAIRNTQLFARLRERQRQLEAVLLSVPDMLFVLEKDGTILLINTGAQQILGLANRTKAIGSHLADFAQHSDIFLTVVETLSNRPPLPDEQYSFEVRNSTGRQQDYVVNISAWEDPTVTNGGYVVLMHDVTTLRNLYRFKDEMLRIVSHDLRSPLAVIAGYADLFQQDLPADSFMQEYVESIQRSIERMGNLLEDLLKVRQIDEKGLHLEPNTPLADLVLSVFQGAVLASRQKGQQILNQITIPTDFVASVDPTLLRQAMENFASNAIKYTPEDGTIIIRAYLIDGRMVYEVEDNGIGIPPHALSQVFDAFYRVNARQNASISGAGLGLSLVKSIVERHEGQVWVKSVEGVGSTFGMWIPLYS